MRPLQLLYPSTNSLNQTILLALLESFGLSWEAAYTFRSASKNFLLVVQKPLIQRNFFESHQFFLSCYPSIILNRIMIDLCPSMNILRLLGSYAPNSNHT